MARPCLGHDTRSAVHLSLPLRVVSHLLQHYDRRLFDELVRHASRRPDQLTTPRVLQLLAALAAVRHRDSAEGSGPLAQLLDAVHSSALGPDRLRELSGQTLAVLHEAVSELRGATTAPILLGNVRAAMLAAAEAAAQAATVEAGATCEASALSREAPAEGDRMLAAAEQDAEPLQAVQDQDSSGHGHAALLRTGSQAEESIAAPAQSAGPL